MSASKLFTKPRVGVALAVVLFALDQVSKEIILATFFPGEVREVIPGLFNLVLTFNKGVAFGIFSGIDHDGIRMFILLTATLVAFAVVMFYLRGYDDPPWRVVCGVGAVCGGAFGNLVDRVRHGAVTDFLDFHLGGYHWPAFNIADSAICIGVLLLLLAPAAAPKESQK